MIYITSIKKVTGLLLIASFLFVSYAEAVSIDFQVTASASSITLVPGTSFTLTSTIKNTGTQSLTFPTLTNPPLISSGPGFILVPQDTRRNIAPLQVRTLRGPNVLGFHADIFGITLLPGESFTYIYQIISVLSTVTMNTSLDFGALLIPNVPQGFVPPSVQGNFISTAVFSIPIRSGQQQILGPPVTVSASARMRDSFLRANRKNLNEGGNHNLVVDKWGHKRTVMGFDLAGVRDEITNAQLVLTLKHPTQRWGANGRLVNIHLLLEPFTEGNGFVWGQPRDLRNRGSGSGVTWNCATDAEIGNRKRDCDNRWRGGSDFIESATDSTLITNRETGEVSWNVTVDVQNALADGASEIQWLLKKAKEHRRGSAVFYSKEGAADMGDMTVAPRLELEFSD